VLDFIFFSAVPASETSFQIASERTIKHFEFKRNLSSSN